eukprot:m.179721 g.179721  ORF g.179721 m.179721 type:complete len:214 (+) comp31988_c3_seq1:440-1081(+)
MSEAQAHDPRNDPVGEPWWAGVISSEEVTSLLQSTEIGTFLVRGSATRGGYFLHVAQGSNNFVASWALQNENDNDWFIFRNENRQGSFTTIKDLVEDLKANGVAGVSLVKSFTETTTSPSVAIKVQETSNSYVNISEATVDESSDSVRKKVAGVVVEESDDHYINRETVRQHSQSTDSTTDATTNDNNNSDNNATDNDKHSNTHIKARFRTTR